MQGNSICALLFAAILASAPPIAQFESDKKPEKKKTEASFNAAAGNFLRAIKQRDVVKLSSFVSPDGVSLGHDAPFTPRKVLLKELGEQSGFYCSGFDSDCLNREFRKRHGDDSGPDIPSYRELLIEPALVSVDLQVVDQDMDGQWWGTITLTRLKPVEGLATYYYFDFMRDGITGTFAASGLNSPTATRGCSTQRVPHSSPVLA